MAGANPAAHFEDQSTVSSKVVIDDWSWKMKVDFTDTLGGAFSTGGGQVGGKEFVMMSLVMFMLNDRMVVAGRLYRNDKAGSVGAEIGAAAMTGPLHPRVGEGELDSARRLGERVARLATKLKRAATRPQGQKYRRPRPRAIEQTNRHGESSVSDWTSVGTGDTNAE